MQGRPAPAERSARLERPCCGRSPAASAGRRGHSRHARVVRLASTQEAPGGAVIPQGAKVLGSRLGHAIAKGRAVLGKNIHRDLTEPYSSLTVDGEKVRDSKTGEELEGAMFTAYHERFHEILGPHPVVKELVSVDWEMAHEGPVWVPALQKLIFNTNRLGDPESANQEIQTWTLDLSEGGNLKLEQLQVDPPLVMANGGTNWSPTEVLLTAQGHREEGGALVVVDLESGKATPLLDNWQGLRFNSPNDLTVGQDRSVWFTDPSAGHLQNFRGPPQLGNHVWRFNARTGSLNLAATGFEMPNGIVLSPDGETLYVTDTGALRPDTPDGGEASTAAGERTVYAFDVVKKKGEPVLINKRAFAIADLGAPDGLKVDVRGNVYGGTGDGVAVWDEGGVMLGKISVGQVGQLVFAGKMLIMLQEQRICTVELAVAGPALPGMLEEPESA